MAARMAVALGLAALAPACFAPHYNQLRCGAGDSCPDGYTCRGGTCEIGGADDAGVAPIDDATGAQLCLGTFVKVCVDVPPTALTLATQMIDTSDPTSGMCLPYVASPTVDACVIAAQTITIASGNTVSVTGRRRLILFAAGSITLAGVLDAASHRGGRTGPAADTGPCPTSVTPPTVAGQGGGGWGGTFGGPGNNGGNTSGGGVGGTAGAVLNIATLGGGCAGGSGAGSTGGSGGHGGGAVALLAGQTITVSGTVNASGAGGNGARAAAASTGGGGGGGGAGGMVVLDAASVVITGQCFTSGGGGGEGSSLIAGKDGGDPGPSGPGNGGSGGSPLGGDGGAGGAGTSGARSGDNGNSTVNPITDAGGGGGGGGGVGIIKIVAGQQQRTNDPGRISPPLR